MAPMDTDFGRFAVVSDPSGASFSVMQAPSEG
jgi:predicted enzyme related to lactoylglutathione lyase